MTKILKIENNKGYFYSKTKNYKVLNDLTTEDLKHILLQAYESDLEFDEFNENTLKNEAHKIIYQKIESKIISIQSQRSIISEMIATKFSKLRENLSE